MIGKPSCKIFSAFFDKAKHMRDLYVTTSWDDGHILDVKLAALLKQYSVKGTFYVSPRDREFDQSVLLSDDQIRDMSNDFEIGAHTMTHPSLPSIAPEAAADEIKDSKKYLEGVIEKPVVSFCYPRGEYRASDVAAVRNAGFTRARTVTRFRYDLGQDPFTLPTSIHAYDHFSDV
jgi:peptidoglycan/xylan/chitin deacetylase (PgdA/CDA1 family)